MSKKKKGVGETVRSVIIKPDLKGVTLTCSLCKEATYVDNPPMAPYMELSHYRCKCGEEFNFSPPFKIGAITRRYD